MTQCQSDLCLLPQSLQQRRVVSQRRWHGLQRMKGAEIAVPHLQQQRVFAFVGNPFKGKTVGNPVGFCLGKMRDFPIQRVPDLVDQILPVFGRPLLSAIVADAFPQIGKALGDLRIGRPIARLFTLAQAGFQSRWR